MQGSSEEQSNRRAAIAILHYLRDHPNAKDTVRGIAQWWVHEKPETVEKALALLLRENVLEKRGNTFQLAPKITGRDARLKQVLQMLQSPPPNAPQGNGAG